MKRGLLAAALTFWPPLAQGQPSVLIVEREGLSEAYDGLSLAFAERQARVRRELRREAQDLTALAPRVEAALERAAFLAERVRLYPATARNAVVLGQSSEPFTVEELLVGLVRPGDDGQLIFGRRRLRPVLLPAGPLRQAAKLCRVDPEEFAAALRPPGSRLSEVRAALSEAKADADDIVRGVLAAEPSAALLPELRGLADELGRALVEARRRAKRD